MPICFFAQTEFQRNFHIFYCELLTAYLAVLHLKARIEGRNITLFIDYKPLTAVYKKQATLKSDIQKCYLPLISEYIRGDENIVAVYLVRQMQKRK